MGEARRKRAALALKCELITTDIRDDIAAIVRQQNGAGYFAQAQRRQCL
jgi:hypothetical protein